MESIVITGMGVVGPCGDHMEAFWNNVCAKKSGITVLDDTGMSKIRFAGRIREPVDLTMFSKRLLNKCDDFSKYALAASYEAVSQAEITNADPKRIGIFIGNNTGGWNSSYTGLQKLHIEKTAVSPYMASNWFPAAVQGHLSLAYGFKGYSKTLISDRTSGILALKHAIRAIETGKVDIAVVGGVEAPINPWALYFYESTGEVSLNGSYSFGKQDGKGYVLAEGAAFLVIEKEKNAVERDAPKIYARISHTEFRQCGKESEKEVLALYQKLLGAAITQTKNPMVFPACVGTKQSDEIERRGLLSRNIEYISLPKLLFGNTVAASALFDIVLAVKVLEEGKIPMCRVCKSTQKGKVFSGKVGVPDSCIVMSMGFGGSMAAAAIKNI